MHIYSLGKQVWLSSGEEHEAAKNELMGCFKLLEGELGDKAYFGDGTFGIVDVALIPFYSWFYMFEQCGNMSIEAECPKLVAWGKRCMEKESVSKTLLDQHKVYDLLMDLKKKILAK